MTRSFAKRVSLLVVVVFCVAAAAHAASRREVANRLEYFRQFFVDFQYAPDAGIPGDLLAECHGVIILRQYKAGFMLGVKGGDGVIFMHDRRTGEWSAPAFVRTAEGSFGFQLGGQSVDAIILIMNQSGVDMLLKSRFMIGVDASAAAGPVGRDLKAQVGAGTALLMYARSKGLFAGAAFEGGALLNHDAYNEAMYGMPVGLRDILIERRVPVPVEAGPMIQTLKGYSVYTQASSQPGNEAGNEPYRDPYQSRIDPWIAPLSEVDSDDDYHEQIWLETEADRLAEEAAAANRRAEEAARRAAAARRR